MTMMELLRRQVPAHRWFAWLGLLGCLYWGAPAAWHGIAQWLRPPPQIQASDRALATWAIDQGWLSSSPQWVAIEDPTAYAAPSPWGARSATLYVGDLDLAWPDPTTSTLFREFALFHELAHIELEVSRPVASNPGLRALGDLVHVVPNAFWVQMFDESHADWQASVMLLRRHGPVVEPFLRKLVDWRHSQALFAPIDPHQQLDVVSPWLDHLANPRHRALWQHEAVPLLRQRLFDDTLGQAAAWLAEHPQDQSDLFQGTSLRPLLDRPLSWPQRQQAEQRQYETAIRLLGRAPLPPRDPSPSQAMRGWRTLSPSSPLLWPDLIHLADQQWVRHRRRQAQASFTPVKTAEPWPP